MTRWLLSALLVLAALAAFSSPASAELPYSGHEDLFYNYYVPPVGPGGVGAQMYLCPRPTPPLVGHTYITYQPLMPHEFLWRHHRTYIRYHADGSHTRTRVRWN